jgi:glucose/arabinose dehydrogenase
MGETGITASIWRFDPEAASPRMEVVARGIRNAWSFAWNDRRELFTASNGPDANAGEELDFVDPSVVRHHGFPYQFGDWPIERKAYPHTPPAPEGLRFVLPVKNLGPDGWEGPLPGSTFSPHSSPAGMVWLGDDSPEVGRESFLIGRFGTLLKVSSETDPGFDVLSVRPRREGDAWVAETRTFLKGLGRPIDLLRIDRRIYVLEYTRPTDFRSGRGWLPGRILEVSPSGRIR